MPLCRRRVSQCICLAVASEIGRDFSPDIKANREAIHRSAESQSEARRAKRPIYRRCLCRCIFLSSKTSAKSHVKPPPHQKIPQLQPHQHLPVQTKVRISYVPLAKLDIEELNQALSFGDRSARSKARPPAGPNLLILAILAISHLFGRI
jgi:hypothetical protein